MIPWPTTFGTLSEVNHWEVLSCNLFSTFLYPIQIVELGTQPNYIHGNWMASFYKITWYFHVFPRSFKQWSLHCPTWEPHALYQKHFLKHQFEKFIRNGPFVWCLPLLFRLQSYAGNKHWYLALIGKLVSIGKMMSYIIYFAG